MWQCSAKIFYFFLCDFYLLILFVIHFLGHIFTFINKRICLDFILFQQGNIFYYFILFLCHYAFFYMVPSNSLTLYFSCKDLCWWPPCHSRSASLGLHRHVEQARGEGQQAPQDKQQLRR